MKKRKSLILGKEESLLNRFSYIFLWTYTLNALRVNVLYLAKKIYIYILKEKKKGMVLILLNSN